MPSLKDDEASGQEEKTLTSTEQKPVDKELDATPIEETAFESKALDNSDQAIKPDEE
jgi:hypothetical protein